MPLARQPSCCWDHSRYSSLSTFRHHLQLIPSGTVMLVHRHSIGSGAPSCVPSSEIPPLLCRAVRLGIPPPRAPSSRHLSSLTMMFSLPFSPRIWAVSNSLAAALATPPKRLKIRVPCFAFGISVSKAHSSSSLSHRLQVL